MLKSVPCMLILFENFCYLYHSANMDNWFNSVFFLCSYILQDNGPHAGDCASHPRRDCWEVCSACGVVKVTVLNRDCWAHALIAASCFDQKTLYMISNIAINVGWNIVKKYNQPHSMQCDSFLFSTTHHLSSPISNGYNQHMSN